MEIFRYGSSTLVQRTVETDIQKDLNQEKITESEPVSSKSYPFLPICISAINARPCIQSREWTSAKSASRSMLGQWGPFQMKGPRGTEFKVIIERIYTIQLAKNHSTCPGMQDRLPTIYSPLFIPFLLNVARMSHVGERKHVRACVSRLTVIHVAPWALSHVQGRFWVGGG